MAEFKFPTKKLFKRSSPDVTLQEGSQYTTIFDPALCRYVQAPVSSGGKGSPPVPSPPVNQPPDSETPEYEATCYAVTVNIKPNKVMNRRRWKLYNAEQQRALLTRLEASFRKDTPSVVLKKLTFETCPSNGNIHFHCLYQCPKIYESSIINYWNEKVDGNDLETKVPWRHIVVEECYDTKGWIQYISKYVNL